MFYPFSSESKTLAPLLEQAIADETHSLVPRVSRWEFAGASMFDYYCMFLWASESPPDLTIIPINWLGFSEEGINPGQRFQPELSGLAPLRYIFSSHRMNPIRSRGVSLIKQLQYKVSLYSIYFIGLRGWARANVGAFLEGLTSRKTSDDDPPKALARKTEEQIEDAENRDREAFVDPVERVNRAAGGGLATDDRELLSTRFPMKLSKSNHILSTVETLADVASDQQTKVLFYIWPLDREYLAEVGVLDEKSLERSIRMIAEAADGRSTYFVDLSDLLKHEFFYDDGGHCTIGGRRIIAETLGPIVLDIIEEGLPPDPSWGMPVPIHPTGAEEKP